MLTISRAELGGEATPMINARRKQRLSENGACRLPRLQVQEGGVAAPSRGRAELLAQEKGKQICYSGRREDKPVAPGRRTELPQVEEEHNSEVEGGGRAFVQGRGRIDLSCVCTFRT